ncbi:MAG TPA: hypothetical protein VHW65_07020 [Gemmatimonadales bacterium]|nr:hypothetical protein [Gemmatimonadales bacterium]
MTPGRGVQRFAFSVALLLALAGCAASTDTNTAPPVIALALTPTADTIAAGDSVAVIGVVTRSHYTADVQIEVGGAPAGVTATVATMPVNGGDSASVELHAASGTATGTYRLIVTASGFSVASVRDTFALTVAPPGFTLAASPPSLVIAQGDTNGVVVLLKRLNFPANVVLSIVGVPSGVAATFSPDTVTTSAAGLTLGIGVAVPPATYNLTIHGSSAGVTDVTTPFTLIVVQSSGSLWARAVRPQ